MPKTPDEIKKGMECHINGECNQSCPYFGIKFGCGPHMVPDALALIQQLEAQNAEKAERIRVLESRNNALYHTILGVMHFVDKWLDVPAYDPDEDLNGTTAVGRASHAREIALQAIEHLEAERDAAVEDLETVCGMCSVCCACKYRFEGGKACRGCVDSSHWQWRGVQKEE